MRKWKRISSKVIHNNPYGKVRINKYDIGQRRKLSDYTILETRNVVIIFAVTSDIRAVLIKEYNPGGDYIGWELPAGYIDPNETPVRAAIRELGEETGYVGEKPEHLISVFVAPGKMTMKVYCYLVRSAEKILKQDPDWSESIRVKLVPVKKLFSMVLSEKIRGAASVSAIYSGLERLKQQ